MDILLIAARAIQFVSTISLCGVLAFECLVAGPAFHQSATDPATAEHLRRNFAWLCWLSLVLVLVSGAAWLAASSSNMSGQPLTTVLSQGILITVITKTRFGEVWLLRLALAALLGCCLLAQSRQRNWASGIAAWAALAVASPLLATLAWAGHGGATPGAPGELHLAADISHLVAAGLWLGTLVPLAMLLAEARRIAGVAWISIARAVTRRFSLIAVTSVVVLFVAGLVNTWFLAGTVPALIGTEYGRLLSAKIAVFAVMLLIAAVNLLRLTPRLATRSGALFGAALGQLRRNAFVEAGCGLAVLAIVGVIGVLPPGLHTEPGWPLPFRLDLGALSPRTAIAFVALSALLAICLIGIVSAAAAGHYRRISLPLAGLVLCLVLAWLPLRSVIEPAYPTSFYAPAEPYAAASVARGVPLYAENCAVCHGAGGKGDGPAAPGLPIRPADLTAPHLFGHPEGDLFWWISRGRANGAMPGFASIMNANRRWDVINFIRARAAGVLSRRLGSAVTADAAFPVPDFAFERDGRQQTLSALLKSGPVLLVLITPPVSAARLARIDKLQHEFPSPDRHAIAVDVSEASAKPAAQETMSPFATGISPDVAASLRLFVSPTGGSATALMLDRAGNVRARWTENGGGGLADIATLVAAAGRVARFPVAAPSHAGHAH